MLSFLRPDRAARERGVSLFELLVVVAILSILSLIIGSNLPAARAQAQTSACQTNLRAIATAAEQYYSSKNSYPTSGGVNTAMFVNGTTNYLQSQPVDPADPTQAATYTFTNNSANGIYQYSISCPGQHDPATLSALPLSGTGGLSPKAGGGCTKPCVIILDSDKNIYTK